ncbi:hypothetical protein CROQUDRAFT_375056 [Cronartium quercuum f. sp. fusiforme G11]|uniref:Thioredoxin domain-containing protein n=1 Tax=Cronartium quercuum f. sp. fusiforme G11 TaxID=708437 RepID=A0A9P6T7A2_9BASI|nr:hypothetical protein CROQUDRAFT_375056 [Cronartium quercuum f. sp. fusiforme G11]
MKSIELLILFTAFLPNCLGGIFNSKGDVKLIDAARLKKHVKTSSKGTLVAFYAPWCGHCKNLQPEFEKAATNVKNLVVFAAVDCDAEQNKQACGQDYGVKGFPTIKYYPGLPVPLDYQDERKAKPMVDFVLKKMPTFAKKIKSKKDLSDKISNSTKSRPLVVLFTTATATTPTYKSLSSVFYKKMDVYTATPKAIGEDTAKTDYQIESLPALIVFTGDGTDGIHQFNGKLNYGNLYSFIKSKLPLDDNDNDEKKKKDKKNDEPRKATGEL